MQNKIINMLKNAYYVTFLEKEYRIFNDYKALSS